MGRSWILSERRKLTAVLLGWTALITALHLAWNVSWSQLINDFLPKDKRKLNVAYIPVT